MNTKKQFDRQKAVIKAAETLSAINEQLQKENEQAKGAIFPNSVDLVLLHSYLQLLSETQRFEAIFKAYEQSNKKQ